MGQVNMRDTRVEEVEHISDSDSDEVSQNVEKAMPEPTIGIFPNHVHQGPTYLIFPNRAEQEKWLYQLTVVSGAYSIIIRHNYFVQYLFVRLIFKHEEVTTHAIDNTMTFKIILSQLEYILFYFCYKNTENNFIYYFPVLSINLFLSFSWKTLL